MQIRRGPGHRFPPSLPRLAFPRCQIPRRARAHPIGAAELQASCATRLPLYRVQNCPRSNVGYGELPSLFARPSFPAFE